METVIVEILFNENNLVGKVISKIEIGGYGISLVTEDGFKLDYNASDGGCSSWEISKEEVLLGDEQMNNLINKDDLSNEIQRIYDEHYSESTSQAIHDIFNAVFKRIQKEKAVEAEPVRHGHWSEVDDDGEYACSHCGWVGRITCLGKDKIGSSDIEYCPYCGAKME